MGNEEIKDDYVITLKDINLKYEGEKGVVTALENVNLNIENGEFICVLGPSGCGKSTLLKIIAGLLAPSSGEAKMDQGIIKGPDYNRGVVFQNPTLYPWLNIRDNVGFGLKMRKFPKEDIARRTKQYLELVNLSEFEKHKPYELSGGMKQRASLAKVLVNNPRVILMDEPLGALDALTRQNMQSLIRSLWWKTNKTVFLITHDVDEALSLGTRVIVMSSRPGRIVKEFKTDFTYNITGDNGDRCRYSDHYLKIREEILNLINDQGDKYVI
ncbi:ABC transporter ATP-binding protein [Clostridium cylindrosporum]|uniref:Taurine import ATP-binding protein TauB n=1 Tax=Clostridium cylindrosporum DSM 605 TaxID=1121307 RepID=A0A0J8D7E3_CLOCY|nr:ABC transporter ATP-binding protein [Clostridium cylindrosporum]KMT21817.1 taurine import ATP-binding protein TauB [Clostridium cylindrosporum DSM 605]